MDSADSARGQTTRTSIGVHPRILQPASFPPFDLYVRQDGNGGFMAFRKAHEPVYANTWERLARGGFELLYVRGEDYDPCMDYVEEHLRAILEQDFLPGDDLAQWLYRLASRRIASLLQTPDSHHDYGRVKALVEGLVRTVRSHPGAEWDMISFAPKTYSTSAHCVSVCLLMVSLASKVLGLTESGALEQVALGSILHDLGKAMIPADILSKPGGLTRHEFAQVKRHPSQGLQIARPYIRQAPIAQCIIGQHHENASGDGYPEGRHGDAINTFARAARIVDSFDALTTDRPYGRALDNYGALNTMVSEMRGQFDMPLLRKFIRHMGTETEERPITLREVTEAGEATEILHASEVAAPVVEKEAQQPILAPVVTDGPIIRLEPVASAPPTAPEADRQAKPAEEADDEPQTEDLLAAITTMADETQPEPLPQEDNAELAQTPATPEPVTPAAAPPETVLLTQEAPPPAQDEVSELDFLGLLVAEPLATGDATPAPPPQAKPPKLFERARPAPARPEPVPPTEEITVHPSSTEADVTLDATLMERLAAIQALTAHQTRDTGMMAGIMGALKTAFEGPLKQGVMPPDPRAAAGPRAAREAEAAFARGLFPVVWQLDEWMTKFTPMPHQSAEVAAACAETRECLQTLRDWIVRVLAAHHVEVIDDADGTDPSLHQPVDESFALTSTAGAPRVRRVGFLYRDGTAYEVLEPARVVVRP
ncbi:MAG: HD-GYP domain-containing protein, partial [Planctomycetota bacterium]